MKYRFQRRVVRVAAEILMVVTGVLIALLVNEWYGPITASALVASIADIRAFKNARQLAAWLGLVPRQHSTGGKQVLLGISKRGDTYLRTLLIHGGRSVLLAQQRSARRQESWSSALAKRRHPNIAAVALANKNARIVWALLARGQEYQPHYHASMRSAA